MSIVDSPSGRPPPPPRAVSGLPAKLTVPCTVAWGGWLQAAATANSQPAAANTRPCRLSAGAHPQAFRLLFIHQAAAVIANGRLPKDVEVERVGEPADAGIGKEQIGPSRVGRLNRGVGTDIVAHAQALGLPAESIANRGHTKGSRPLPGRPTRVGRRQRSTTVASGRCSKTFPARSASSRSTTPTPSTACQRLGLRVPADVAVLGVDNSLEAHVHRPPLSSIRPPRRVTQAGPAKDGGRADRECLPGAAGRTERRIAFAYALHIFYDD